MYWLIVIEVSQDYSLRLVRMSENCKQIQQCVELPTARPITERVEYDVMMIPGTM